MENKTQVTAEQIPPTVPVDPAPPVVKAKGEFPLLLVVGGVVVFLIIIAVGLLVGFTLINKPKVSKPVPPPPPPPIVEFTPPPVTNSRFASDSALLKIREDLRTLRNRIDTTDIFDAKISPPTIDTNISIKQ